MHLPDAYFGIADHDTYVHRYVRANSTVQLVDTQTGHLS